MKYAFKENGKGKISVTLKAGGENAVLIIEDNGKGIPENYDFSSSKGFGLTLVKMLSKQLKGSFSIETGKGTKSRVEFKV